MMEDVKGKMEDVLDINTYIAFFIIDKKVESFKKVWVRIVVSLIAGGMTTELVFIFSGDPTRHRSADDPNYTILYAIVYYIALTVAVKRLYRGKN